MAFEENLIHSLQSRSITTQSWPMLSTTVAVLSTGFLAWGYKSIKAPPPKICGSSDGPAVTAPRIKLRDGRHLAYQGHGVPKQNANYKILFVHGFGSCRQDGAATVDFSPEIVKDMGIYVVSFDRPGYGESYPDPKRTAKSLALDMEELADGLELGSKFYVAGYSMGGQAVWGCLKYISHRIAGAALLAPVANYWWSGIPKGLSKEAYNQQLKQDQWAVRVAHYTPWLTYFWNTKKWFLGSSVVTRVEKMSRKEIINLIINCKQNKKIKKNKGKRTPDIT